jgi:hypothetical protein
MVRCIDADRFQVARFVLRLTFVILSCVGFAVSALLIALAFALEGLYLVPALPWAFATLALPACGLVALRFSTRLARFVAGASNGRAFAGDPMTGSPGPPEPTKPYPDSSRRRSGDG